MRNNKALFLFVILATLLISGSGSKSEDCKTNIIGQENDVIRHVMEIPDNRYVLSGYSISNNKEFRSTILVANDNGEMLERIQYDENDVNNGIITLALNDTGGYIGGGFKSGSNDESLFWVFDLDDNFNVLWQKELGNGVSHLVHSIDSTIDGGIVFTGESTFIPRQAKTYLYKIDSEGKQDLERVFDDEFSMGNFVREYELNQYVVVYISISDTKVVIINNDGEIKSVITLPEFFTNSDTITMTEDGVIVLLGGTAKASNNHALITETWFLKIHVDGGNLRKDGQSQYGEKIEKETNDNISKIIESNEGGYLILGYNKAPEYLIIDEREGDTSAVKPNNKTEVNDIFVTKISDDGIVEWKKRYKNKEKGVPSSIIQSDNGSYLIIGHQKLQSGNKGIFTMKIDSDGTCIN